MQINGSSYNGTKFGFELVMILFKKFKVDQVICSWGPFYN